MRTRSKCPFQLTIPLPVRQISRSRFVLWFYLLERIAAVFENVGNYIVRMMKADEKTTKSAESFNFGTGYELGLSGSGG